MSNISKLLSRILRHAPEEVSLALEPGGWVPLDELVAGLRRAGHDLDREVVLQIVKESDKKQFTISEDGKRIRAAQGHSVRVDLGSCLRPLQMSCSTARQVTALVPSRLKASTRVSGAMCIFHWMPRQRERSDNGMAVLRF